MKKLFGKKLGLTLLETVVAFAVLLIAILYVLQLYATGQGVFLKSQFRTEAVKLGQEVLESTRTLDSIICYAPKCKSVLSGNYYNVEFSGSGSSAPLLINPVPIPTVTPTETLKSLDVTVTGPYQGLTSVPPSGAACKNIDGTYICSGNCTTRCDASVFGGKPVSGNVTVHLQTWVAK